MSLQYSPKIITDSLVMCLDASNNKSYPAADLPVKGGLVMWMDAADDTTFSYSSGTTVSQWRDKSGFNYHMIPVSAGPTRNAFLNSRKVLAFTTSQDIQNLTIDLRTSAYTIFVVDRYTNAASGTQRILTANPGNAGSNWLLGHWGGSADRYYAEGWVYASGTFTDVIWRLYMGDWSSATTDLANFYNNGTSLASNSTNASGGPYSLGINANSGERSNCEVAEIVVFNRVLSTTERRLVDTYLGQKWGISNTDRQIFDLSGFNDNGLFGNGTVANMPDYNFYNKGTLTFNGTSDYAYQSLFNNTITTTLTFDVWVKFSDTGSSGRYIMSLGRDIGVPSGGIALLAYGFSSASSGQIIFEFGSGYGRVSSGIVPTTDIWYNLTVTADGTNTRFYVNSVLANTASQTTGAVTSSPGLSIGSYLNSATPPTPGTPFFYGNIGSVKIYNKTLSQAEISQNYEAQKSKFANTIVQQGLVLNLDAGNPYSYAGAGTTWYDVSGNSNNGTLTNGPTYNADVGGNIVFDGVDDCVVVNSNASILPTTAYTKVAWFYATNFATGNNIISGGNSGQHAFWLAGGNKLNSGHNGNWSTVVSTTTLSLNTWYFGAVTFNTTTGWILYLNGVSENTNVSTTTFVGNGEILLAAYSTGANVFTGRIACGLVYNRVLTATEILQNYNATKGRFGLL